MLLHPTVDQRSQTIIDQLNCPAFNELLVEALDLMKPASMYIQTSSKEEIEYARINALAQGQELSLLTKGHTYHFDAADDVDSRKDVLVLIDDQTGLADDVPICSRKEGMSKVYETMKNCMVGKQLLVSFYCLGPVNSPFAKVAVQFTDSWHILHTGNVLYRNGFAHMVSKHVKEAASHRSFYTLCHSVGSIDAATRQPDPKKRKIYLIPEDHIVYTMNNAYAGSAFSCQKIAIQLAIYEAHRHSEKNYLAEYMFLSSYPNPCVPNDKVNVCGMFLPSSGRTSTTVLDGASVLSGDAVYIHVDEDNLGNRKCKAIGVGAGISGNINGVNAVESPLVHGCLTSERECIFSNILVGEDGKPYWNGMYYGKKQEDMVAQGSNLVPERGYNHNGEWQRPALPLTHSNARFTINLKDMDGVLPDLDNPDGVQVDLIVYGGRDSNTCPPVYQAHNWAHGVYIGSAMEYETLEVGQSAHNATISTAMASLNYPTVPIHTYLNNYMNFGRLLGRKTPQVFGLNYFLRHPVSGEYITSYMDKKVWMAWACGCTRGHYKAKCTPIGWIPYYEDLQKLFRSLLNVDYTKQQYDIQFTINVDKYIQKMTRIMKLYGGKSAPTDWIIMECRVMRALKKLEAERGSVVSPSAFDDYKSQAWFDSAFSTER